MLNYSILVQFVLQKIEILWHLLEV